MSSKDAIREFVKTQPPPGGTPQWEQWKTTCQSFPSDDAVEVFLDVLRHGDDRDEQYVCLIGLRFFGFSAYGEGYGPDLVYKLKSPGSLEEEVIWAPPERHS